MPLAAPVGRHPDAARRHRRHRQAPTAAPCDRLVLGEMPVQVARPGPAASAPVDRRGHPGVVARLGHDPRPQVGLTGVGVGVARPAVYVARTPVLVEVATCPGLDLNAEPAVSPYLGPRATGAVARLVAGTAPLRPGPRVREGRVRGLTRPRLRLVAAFSGPACLYSLLFSQGVPRGTPCEKHYDCLCLLTTT